MVPFAIYQTSVQNLTFNSIYCNIINNVNDVNVTDVNNVDVKVGLTCVSGVTNSSNIVNYVKIDFLTSGLVLNVSIERPFETFENTTLDSLSWQVTGLPFGGYLLTSSPSDENEIYYYLFDVNFKRYKWDLEGPQPSTIGTSFVLPNNTLMMAQPETDNGWSFKAIDLHKFNNDNDYSNANIKTTLPTIDH